MRKDNRHYYSKVYYRPIEAAIRWSGLVRFESHILNVVGNNTIPACGELSQWPLLRLNIERILDASRNGELPYGKYGITCNDPSLLDDPDLTIRHVDLRRWMQRYYPNQKPSFLFDDLERQLHPAITLQSVQALLIERDVWRDKFNHADRRLQSLKDTHQALTQQHASLLGKISQPNEMSHRAEATYLHIIGGLVHLMLSTSPSGIPYSNFKTQDAIISALVAHHGNLLGISQSTLENKFAEAKRRL
ncbi:receptor protein-tyrosine kinase [Billgrantia endophytica]|uniref:Receptor protein-tyrosine kinase n=1 Tax=Billgrantia endophytica TaxID=2033802 RepID=A0A2N7U4D7_9GAMM|nr:receptor protein-tyrosine kinase [Halomonas endophytica]PMR75293.1 receptor protein-tyrosine kinase [Halomonas endophytica]